MVPTYPIGHSPAPSQGKKIFDCSICDELPGREIEAADEDEAKRIYLAAIIKALTVDMVDAFEVEIVA